MIRKRALYWMVAMLCLMGIRGADAQAAEELAAVSIGRYTILVNGQGAQLVPSDTYGNIYPVMYDAKDYDKVYYAASSVEEDNVREQEHAVKFAVLDETGKQITGFDYDNLFYDKGYIIVVQDELYGALNMDLEVAVPCEYTNLVSNGEGGFLGLRTDPYDDTADGVYYIDEKGGETATGVKVSMPLYGAASGPIPAASADDSRYGYLNAQGRWVIQPQFDWSGPFSNGYASAQTQSGAGLINESGNWVLTPKYTYIDMGYGDSQETPILACLDNTQVNLIDRKSMKPIAAFTGATVGGYITDKNLAVVICDEKSLLVDNTGKTLFETEKGAYISLWDQLDDTVVVTRGVWGEKGSWLSDLSGNKLSDEYQSLSALGEKDGKAYYVFSQFEVKQSTYTYDGQQYTVNDEVAGTRRCGVIDNTGKVVLSPEYETLYALGNGLMAVEADGYAGVADYTGNMLLKLELP